MTILIYICIAILVIALGWAISLGPDGRRLIKSLLLSLPVLSLFFLLVFICYLKDNKAIALILVLGFCILLALPIGNQVESFQNSTDDDDDDDADVLAKQKENLNSTLRDESRTPPVRIASRNPDASDELYDNEDLDKPPMIAGHRVQERNKIEPVRNYLGKSLGLYDNKYADIFDAAVSNNKKAMRQRLKAIRQQNNTRGSNNDREGYQDVNSGISINKRKFNLNDEIDKDLINTREICVDIINRINYEYEDKEYLKKYISARIEEIIDMNKLLDD